MSAKRGGDGVMEKPKILVNSHIVKQQYPKTVFEKLEGYDTNECKLLIGRIDVCGMTIESLLYPVGFTE